MFKGGTSLSKCYNLIERFSEDIDLSLNMEDLGFGEEKAPHELLKTISKREAEKAVDQLKLAGETFLSQTLLPMLLDQITMDIGSSKDWSLSIDPSNPENILFYYPKSLHTNEYGD
jgi:predicted nucleotidyltransferase component of viral defense system